MKNVKIEITFNVSEKDFKKEELQQMITSSKNGEWSKDLKKDCPFNPKDLTITIKIK